MNRPALSRCAIALVAAVSCAAALSPSEQAAIDRISADSMRANLSFLASDALEGRATPSRGLDIAAEFIAAQFRRAGLEPIATDGSYFQTASLSLVTPNMTGVHFTLRAGTKEIDFSGEELRVRSPVALDLKDAPVVVLPDDGELTSIRGSIVAGSARRYGNEAALAKLQMRKPAVILLLGRRVTWPSPAPYLQERNSLDAPVFNMAKAEAADALSGKEPLSVSLHLAAPNLKEVTAHNVGAILRGSDPALSDQYVLLSAHYDHMGMLPEGTGDRIYNGANDNGSGTVSVIEIGSALASVPVHPKRSIVFMTWYGEEEGLLGAFYYTRHPIVPLKDTVANINLEQMGRTDEQDGKQVDAFAFTGTSYSDLPGIMGAAAEEENVRTYQKKNADAFFNRSDNYAFALAGVVAHTAVVAFEYPDYHGLADEWQKIDYINMANVDRGVAAGILRIANTTLKPTWSDVKQTAPFREAAK